MYPSLTKKTYVNFRDWLNCNYPNGPSQDEFQQIAELDEQFDYNDHQFYDFELEEGKYEDNVNNDETIVENNNYINISVSKFNCFEIFFHFNTLAFLQPGGVYEIPRLLKHGWEGQDNI